MGNRNRKVEVLAARERCHCDPDYFSVAIKNWAATTARRDWSGYLKDRFPTHLPNRTKPLPREVVWPRSSCMTTKTTEGNACWAICLADFDCAQAISAEKIPKTTSRL